jgi:Flp pilus assembly protein TadG
MKKWLNAQNEQGNNIVFVLGIIAMLAALFGFSVDSIRFMHASNAVQQSLDKASIAWLTAYNSAQGNPVSRASQATSSAQIVYRDNIGYISNMLYCSTICGNAIQVSNASSTTVTLRVTERMDFVYLDSIRGPNGVSLEELINNNPDASIYLSDAIIGNPSIP